MENSKEAAVRSFLGLFHARELDLAGIRAALADDARWQPVVPIADIVEGADAICAEAARQFQIYTDCDCEILAIAARGNIVFTERVDRVRMLHDGREVITRAAGVFELDDRDRIVFWRDYWDLLDIADQVGVTGEQMRGMMDSKVPA